MPLRLRWDVFLATGAIWPLQSGSQGAQNLEQELHLWALPDQPSQPQWRGDYRAFLWPHDVS